MQIIMENLLTVIRTIRRGEKKLSLDHFWWTSIWLTVGINKSQGWFT